MKQHRKLVDNKLKSFKNRIIECETEIKLCQRFINELRFPEVEIRDSAEAKLLVRYSKQKAQNIQKSENIVNEFKNYISGLDAYEKDFLIEKYIEQKSIYNIAGTKHYSPENIKKIIAKAQDKLSKKEVKNEKARRTKHSI